MRDKFRAPTVIIRKVSSWKQVVVPFAERSAGIRPRRVPIVREGEDQLEAISLGKRDELVQSLEAIGTFVDCCRSIFQYLPLTSVVR